MKQLPKTTDRPSSPVQSRQRPLPLSARDKISIFLRKALHLPTLRPDGELIGKIMICAALTILFALLQTTIFARFRPFGAIPDLILPLVIAIGMTEGEKWGAVWGLIGAFIIESLGAAGFSLLPLLYMPAGYLCPVVTGLYLTDTPPVRLIFTAVSGLGRSLVTLLYLALTAQQFELPLFLSAIVFPEYASTFVMALPVHLLVFFALRPFHKSRSERVTTL